MGARLLFLTDEEVDQLMAAARRAAVNDRGRRDRALIAALLNTGIRPGEAVALVRADLRGTDRAPLLRVRRLKKRAAKGVIDDLPISRALARLLHQVGRSCTADARLFPMTVRNAEKVFHRLARAADLRLELRLYSLRHTASTRAYRATRDLRLVQDQLGHSSPNVTAIYTHVDPEARRRTAELVGSAV